MREKDPGSIANDKREGALKNKNSENLTSKEVDVIIREFKVHQSELERQNKELKRLHAELEDVKVRYFDIYDLAPVGYLIISEKGLILEANLTAVTMLGHSRAKLLNQRLRQYIDKADQDIYDQLSNKLLASTLPQVGELHMVRSDGRIFWVYLKVSVTITAGISTYRLILSDISERKQIEETLTASEEKYKSLVMSMDQGLALHEIILDGNGKPVDYIFIDINDSYTRLLGLTRDMCIGKRIKEVMPLVEEYWIDVFGQVALTGEPGYYENYLEATGRYYSTYAYSPRKNRFAVLVSDIDERIRREAQINYLSYHDHLTGLYNRRFYEEELIRLDTEKNLPLTLVMGDLNGLKLINDSFGHKRGDEMLKNIAAIISESCRADDILARIGGDEFIIILPNTDALQAEKMIARINELASTRKVAELDISISFGFDTKISKTQKIEDIFKGAEDHMYRHKLYESGSIKHKMVGLIMNTLNEKNPREQRHSKRVSEICMVIARSMDFSHEAILQIKIAGLMHDIGKIGIDEAVLNSEGKLSATEWEEIKRHPEVSYRILNACNEFSEIANFALEHHERWDGSGYPKGLKGEAISVPARIIAIADAFDAMTSERTYKKVLSEKDAIKEIKRCAGIQFDPEIVQLFVAQFIKE